MRDLIIGDIGKLLWVCLKDLDEEALKRRVAERVAFSWDEAIHEVFRLEVCG
jgi:hypothetical protein